MILGVKNSTCSKAILGEFGRFPLQLRQKICIVKYWIRLRRMKNSGNCIVTKIFSLLANLDNLGYITWVSHVREILSEYGLEEYYSEDFSFDTNSEMLCIQELKEKVYTHVMASWETDIKKQPILRTYIQFKQEFRFETYLLCIKDFKIRKTMSKFRVSSHDFAIEKGRHCKPKVPIDNRICNYCNLEVEDEMHVLLSCSRCTLERETFFSAINASDININSNLLDIFINILSSKDERVIFLLGKFLFKIFKKRG
jgi:hypothetical protein